MSEVTSHTRTRSGLSIEDIPIIDAHHHLWDLQRNYYPWLSDQPKEGDRLGNYESIRRTYTPEDYRRDTTGFRILKTVHIEAEMDRNNQVGETAWLHEMHDWFGLPNAVVGHVWFAEPDCDSKLAAHAAYPLVRGIRSKPVTSKQPGENVHGQPGTMTDPKWRKGYALLENYGFSWDLRVPAWHLEEAADVAAEFPQIPIVLNHTGYPVDRSPDGLAMWRKGMAALAACPNVTVKISELGIPDQPWTVENNRAVVLDAIAIFGIQRCMFGSNYPPASLFASFDTIVRGIFEIVHALPEGDLRAFFFGNAERIYRPV